MSFALPIVGVLLAAIAAALSRRQPDAPNARPLGQDLVGILVLLVVGLFAALRFGPDLDRAWIAVGAILGCVGILLATRAAGNAGSSAAWGIAIGTCAHLVPDPGLPAAQAALIAAAGLASVIAGGHGAALAAMLVIGVDRFGTIATDAAGLPWAGSVFGCALIAAYVISQLLPAKADYRTWVIAGIAQLACLGCYYWLKDQMMAGSAALGVVAAVVLSILIPNSTPTRSFTVGLGAVISVALATVAFALARGGGMGFALLAAGGVLLLGGNTRAILALGPLFGLVLFRLFKNIYPETSRAFDIGQHYALIGLLIAAIVPRVVVDWSEIRLPKMTHAVAAAILAIVLLVLPPVLAVFFGAIGIVGFIVGLGFAGLFGLVRQTGQNEALALSSGVGMGGVLLLSYGWFAKMLDLTREEKVGILMWSAGGMIVAAIAIVALSRKEGK